jgi:hypothetical protein
MKLGAYKIQRLTLKSAFNCTLQQQKSSMAQPARHVQPLALGKNLPAISLFFFLFFSFSQKAEDRASIRIKLCNILDTSPWKASLHHTTPH